MYLFDWIGKRRPPPPSPQPQSPSSILFYIKPSPAKDLFKHLSDLKEGKEAVKNELSIALRNNGEEEAKTGFKAILHAVHIWHGK